MAGALEQIESIATFYVAFMLMALGSSFAGFFTLTIACHEGHAPGLDAAAGVPVTEIADAFGLSRQSVHAWIRRYAEGGLAGLMDRPKRPESCPHEVSGEVETLVCELRREHPRWGQKRLAHELARLEVAPVPSRMSNHRDGLSEADPAGHRARRQCYGPDLPKEVGSRMLSYSLGYSASALSRSAAGCMPFDLVGVAGFEPAASSSRTKRAAKLRYTPAARNLMVAARDFASLAETRTPSRTALAMPEAGAGASRERAAPG